MIKTKTPVIAKLDTGASRNCLSGRIFDTFQNKPKISKVSLSLVSATGNSLQIRGKTEITFKIKNKTFRDTFFIIDGLTTDCLLGIPWLQNYRIGTGWSVTGEHFISEKGEVLATSIRKSNLKPAARTQGSLKLNAHSVSAIQIKTPPNLQCNVNYILEITDKLPKGMVPLEVVHKFEKTPRNLVIPILNYTNKTITVPKKIGRAHV